MIADGDIQEDSLDAALEQVGALANGSLSYQQFAEIIDILQNEMEGLSVDDDDNDDEGDEEVEEENEKEEILSAIEKDQDDSFEVLPNGKGFESAADDNEVDDNDNADIMLELFNDLKGTKNKELPVSVFMEWEDLKEMKEV